MTTPPSLSYIVYEVGGERLKVFIVVFVLLVVGFASIRFYSEGLVTNTEDFASKAYGAVGDDRVSVDVEISNHPAVESQDDGRQQLEFRIEVENISSQTQPKLHMTLRFSKEVAEYLDLQQAPAILFEIGPLQPGEPSTHTHTVYIDQFNGDSEALERVGEILASPLMAQVRGLSVPSYFLVYPSVSLAQQEPMPDEVIIDAWGDLSLSKRTGLGELVLRNSNLDGEVEMKGSNGVISSDNQVIAITEQGFLVSYNATAQPHLLQDKVNVDSPIVFDRARVKVAVVSGDSVLVFDTFKNESYLLADGSNPVVFGWVGGGVLACLDQSLGIRLELLSLEGSRTPLRVDVLPSAISPPVWDAEQRYMAYAASDERVVVVDVRNETSDIIPNASNPMWTHEGLQVIHDLVARVIWF